MRTLRLSLVGTVILTLVGGLAGTVVSQDETTASGEGVTEEPLFEITIPPELMPTVLGKINLERHELSPGSDVAVGIENEGVRGKALYLAEGALRVTPMVDSWVWRGSEAQGGTPEVAVAGEPTDLAVGDVVYLPAVPADRLPPDATTVLANPGKTSTLLLGFHAHDSSIPDVFPGWPSGMSGYAVAVGSGAENTARVLAGDTTFKLARRTLEPRTSMTPDGEAAMVLAEVESGKIESRTVRPGGEFSHEYPAGTGIAAEAAEGQKSTWTASGEEPAVLLTLNVVPTAAE